MQGLGGGATQDDRPAWVERRATRVLGGDGNLERGHLLAQMALTWMPRRHILHADAHLEGLGGLKASLHKPTRRIVLPCMPRSIAATTFAGLFNRVLHASSMRSEFSKHMCVCIEPIEKHPCGLHVARARELCHQCIGQRLRVRSDEHRERKHARLFEFVACSKQGSRSIRCQRMRRERRKTREFRRSAQRWNARLLCRDRPRSDFISEHEEHVEPRTKCLMELLRRRLEERSSSPAMNTREVLLDGPQSAVEFVLFRCR